MAEFLRALPEVILFLAVGRVMWHIKDIRTTLLKLQTLLIPTRNGGSPPDHALAPDWGMNGERCGDCGEWLTVVRPGKYQCDNIECPQDPINGNWGEDSC